MISKQIFSLNFMFLYSLIEELCMKEENDKTVCNFNFGQECISEDRREVTFTFGHYECYVTIRTMNNHVQLSIFFFLLRLHVLKCNYLCF